MVKNTYYSCKGHELRSYLPYLAHTSTPVYYTALFWPLSTLSCHVTGDYLRICGSAAAGVYYHQRLDEQPLSGLLPQNILISEGCVELSQPLT